MEADYKLLKKKLAKHSNWEIIHTSSVKTHPKKKFEGLPESLEGLICEGLPRHEASLKRLGEVAVVPNAHITIQSNKVHKEMQTWPNQRSKRNLCKLTPRKRRSTSYLPNHSK